MLGVLMKQSIAIIMFITFGFCIHAEDYEESDLSEGNEVGVEDLISDTEARSDLVKYRREQVKGVRAEEARRAQKAEIAKTRAIEVEKRTSAQLARYETELNQLTERLNRSSREIATSNRTIADWTKKLSEKKNLVRYKSEQLKAALTKQEEQKVRKQQLRNELSSTNRQLKETNTKLAAIKVRNP